MGSQRVTDNQNHQIMMVQSQMFQQLLARVPACAGSHKFWAIGGQWLISSKILCSESIENLFFAGFLLVHKHPQVERKWQMKGNYICVTPWFLPSPEICFGTYISFKSSMWLQLGISPGHWDWTCKKISQKHPGNFLKKLRNAERINFYQYPYWTCKKISQKHPGNFLKKLRNAERINFYQYPT